MRPAGRSSGDPQPWRQHIVLTSCIDADPRFADPDGPDNDPTTFEDNDYGLALDSPCIDRGYHMPPLVLFDWFDLDGDDVTNEPIPFDLAWQTRRVDIPIVPDLGVGAPPLIDMGCFERQP